MSDEEIAFLKTLIAAFPGKVFYWCQHEGELLPISSVSDNHKDTKDPEEIPESVAWIGRGRRMHNSKCIGLLSADPENFKLMQEVSIVWPS